MAIDYTTTPMPDTDIDLYRPFWSGTREHQLRFPRCRSCGRFHWYPEYRCPHCRGDEIEWVPSSGKGTIWSYTVVRHVFHERYASWLPFVVAFIEFEDVPGIRLVSNITDTAPEDVAIGQVVDVAFQRVTDQVTLPVFRPATG